MDDLISRAKLVADLEAFKLSLGDIVFGYVVDRVIERVKAQPAAEAKKETFLDWRSEATRKAQKPKNDAMLAMIDIVEHTHSGLLEED
jgi:thiamine biosynthesis lipoprotein ApbE